MVGDKVSLRMWSGLPYRSPQTILLESVISEISEVLIEEDLLSIRTADGSYPPTSKEEFSKADGFDSWDDMVKWFSKTHGLPFLGALIKWI